MAVAVAACTGARNPASRHPHGASKAELRARFPADVLLAMGRRTDRAAVLGTGEGGESTVIELARLPTAATLDLTWADATVRLTVGVAGAGNRSRADYLAARAISRAFAKPPRKLAVTVEQRGKSPAVRLPEAQLAASALAAITGAAIDDRVAIIATVYPDGTLGPVTDLEAWVTRAARAGQKTIGVARGYATVREGVVELSDLGDAYTLLTGEALPEPLPVPREVMAISEAESAIVRSCYTRARETLSKGWANLVAGQGPALPRLDATLREAEILAHRAEQARARQDFAAACHAMTRAAALADVVATARALYRAALDGKTPALKLSPQKPVDTSPETPPLAAILARADDVRGEVLRQMAAESGGAAEAAMAKLAARADSDRFTATAAGELLRYVLPVLLADRTADLTRTSGAFNVTLGGSATGDTRSASGVYKGHSPLVAVYQKLARERFDRAKRCPIAESEAHTGESRQVEIARKLLDRAADRLPAVSGLGAAFAAYLAAARLAATRCSLAGRRPAPALIAAADTAARAHAAAARTLTGEIPVFARVAYAIARDAAHAGDFRAALLYYWRASAISQLAIDLALSTARPL